MENTDLFTGCDDPVDRGDRRGLYQRAGRRGHGAGDVGVAPVLKMGLDSAAKSIIVWDGLFLRRRGSESGLRGCRSSRTRLGDCRSSRTRLRGCRSSRTRLRLGRDRVHFGRNGKIGDRKLHWVGISKAAQTWLLCKKEGGNPEIPVTSSVYQRDGTGGP